MSPILGMLLGVGFGWWSAALLKRRTQSSPLDPIRQDQTVKLWILFVAVFAVLALAFGGFSNDLPSNFYYVESFLLSPPTKALVVGFAIGFLASRYRIAIAARLDDFYKAFLGSGEKSSWALQSFVMIGVLLVVVLLFSPELVRRIESFKAGEVEAKFANISEATREATRVNFDLAKVVPVKYWVDFRDNYLDGSPRDAALEFDSSDIKEERKQIRNLLFTDYIVPMAILLHCMQLNDQTSFLKQADELALLVFKIRNRVLGEDGTGRSFGERDWRSILESIDQQIRTMLTIVEANPAEAARCSKLKAIVRLPKWAQAIKEFSDAEKLGQLTHDAVGKLRTIENEKRYTLSFIDPYVAAAVGDMIALTLGHDEKAKYLMHIKSKYPTEKEFIQPGIINLYYQLSDAKVKGDTLWPLDEELKELDLAWEGAEHMIALSRQKSKAPDDQYAKIVDVYTRNKLAFMSRYLEIYYKRTLAGAVLEKADKEKWTRHYRHLEAALDVKGAGTKLAIENAGGAPMTQQEIDEWKRIKGLPVEILFDAKVGLALSAVLLTESNERAGAQACAVARFYLTSAKEMFPDVKSAFDWDEIDLTRLDGFLIQVRARTDAACR